MGMLLAAWVYVSGGPALAPFVSPYLSTHQYEYSDSRRKYRKKYYKYRNSKRQARNPHRGGVSQPPPPEVDNPPTFVDVYKLPTPGRINMMDIDMIMPTPNGEKKWGTDRGPIGFGLSPVILVQGHPTTPRPTGGGVLLAPIAVFGAVFGLMCISIAFSLTAKQEGLMR